MTDDKIHHAVYVLTPSDILSLLEDCEGNTNRALLSTASRVLSRETHRCILCKDGLANMYDVASVVAIIPSDSGGTISDTEDECYGAAICDLCADHHDVGMTLFNQIKADLYGGEDIELTTIHGEHQTKQ